MYSGSVYTGNLVNSSLNSQNYTKMQHKIQIHYLIYYKHAYMYMHQDNCCLGQNGIHLHL